MILLFGGTTEGKKCASLLNLINEEYIYSTKTKVKHTESKVSISGALDFSDMSEVCSKNSVDMIIDAAHPFAIVLHNTIHDVAKELNIPVVRFERHYPTLENLSGVRTFESFESMVSELERPQKFKSLLALTGVQTISRFATVQERYNCHFRILNTELSLKLGLKSGINPDNIIQAKPQIDKHDLSIMIENTKADLLVTKESGVSGFFEQKYELAQELNIPLWIVARPTLPEYSQTVDSTKELLKLILKYRKDVLKNKDNTLRSGLTTGSSVCASAVAALTSLILRDEYTYSEIRLPAGDFVKLPVFCNNISSNSAEYVVVKNGGDDPDVTHGAEVGCKVEFTSQKGVHFVKGLGIGMVTLPGLQVAVGEPAINPTPRKMVTESLTKILTKHNIDKGVIVTPFVPEGEKIALKTFNPRIGVVGGISILGTTGRVMPYSSEAFINSIRQQVKVAAATESNQIVATSGKRSENILKPFNPNLNDLCYVHFGNFIGETIDICNSLKIKKLTIGIMTGKAAKLAEGHLDTHSKKVKFNSTFISGIAAQCGYSSDIVEAIKGFKLANAIADIIPFSEDEPFYKKILELCFETCHKATCNTTQLQLVLINSTGQTMELSKS